MSVFVITLEDLVDTSYLFTAGASNRLVRMTSWCVKDYLQVVCQVLHAMTHITTDNTPGVRPLVFPGAGSCTALPSPLWTAGSSRWGRPTVSPCSCSRTCWSSATGQCRCPQSLLWSLHLRALWKINLINSYFNWGLLFLVKAKSSPYILWVGKLFDIAMCKM